MTDMLTTAASTRRSRRDPGRRQELLDAALRVIRRTGPPVAMDAIATEAGITRPVLYRYFGDVGGIYQAVADHFTTALFDHVRAAGIDHPSGDAVIRAQIDAYLAFIERERNLYRFLTRQFPAERDDGQAAVAGFVAMIGDIVAGFLHRGGLPALAADVAGRSFVGAIQTTGDWWLDQPGITRAQVADQLTAVLWRGFSHLGR